jgi:hypothetical protein
MEVRNLNGRWVLMISRRPIQSSSGRRRDHMVRLSIQRVLKWRFSM